MFYLIHCIAFLQTYPENKSVQGQQNCENCGKLKIAKKNKKTNKQKKKTVWNTPHVNRLSGIWVWRGILKWLSRSRARMGWSSPLWETHYGIKYNTAWAQGQLTELLSVNTARLGLPSAFIYISNSVNAVAWQRHGIWICKNPQTLRYMVLGQL